LFRILTFSCFLYTRTRLCSNEYFVPFVTKVIIHSFLFLIDVGTRRELYFCRGENADQHANGFLSTIKSWLVAVKSILIVIDAQFIEVFNA
jgi:hypothetical protein